MFNQSDPSYKKNKTSLASNTMVPTAETAYLDSYVSFTLEIRYSLTESKTGPKDGPADVLASANAFSALGNL